MVAAVMDPVGLTINVLVMKEWMVSLLGHFQTARVEHVQSKRENFFCKRIKFILELLHGWVLLKIQMMFILQWNALTREFATEKLGNAVASQIIWASLVNELCAQIPVVMQECAILNPNWRLRLVVFTQALGMLRRTLAASVI
jgi:hypothetical protein